MCGGSGPFFYSGLPAGIEDDGPLVTRVIFRIFASAFKRRHCVQPLIDGPSAGPL